MDTEILKNYTKQDHSRAEKTAFMQKLISGDYDKSLWVDHLTNNYLVYAMLEARVPHLKNLGLERSHLLLSDMQGEFGKVAPTTYRLINHLLNLDPLQLYAHIYVRWLGDLNGGKFIARQCKYSHRYLIWEDPAEHIKIIKQAVNPIQDKISYESIVAFDYVTRVCNELL